MKNNTLPEHNNSINIMVNNIKFQKFAYNRKCMQSRL